MKKINKLLLLILFLLCFFLRFYISKLGFNFDYGSWKIVGEIVSSGKNVYLETTRYSYGPVWALILGLFRNISSLFFNDWYVYRLLIVFTLSLTDFLISLILFKRFGWIAFLLVLFNPISIYVSGFNNQFDNLAILTALVALIFLEKNRKKIWGYLLLGLSLAVKHNFLFFPLWLFVSSKSKKERLLSFLPYFIFFISFVPFITSSDTFTAILNNVFLNKRDLLYHFLPNHFLTVPSIILFLNLPFAFLFRKEKVFNQGLYYLLIFTAGLINSGSQYLAIPLSTYLLSPLLGIALSLVGTIHLYFKILPLHLILIAVFNLSWLFIVQRFFKKTPKIINLLSMALLIFSTLYLVKPFIFTLSDFLINQRRQLLVMTVYEQPSRFFSLSSDNIKKPLAKNNVVKGEFVGKGDNLGTIAIPYLLDQASDNFFNRDYRIYQTLKDKKTNKVYRETRHVGNAFVDNEIIFGFPLIADSSGKRFEYTLSTNIPIREKSLYIDLNYPVKEKYFIKKTMLTQPQYFLRFLYYKLISLFEDKKTIFLFFQLYVFLWLIVCLSMIKINKLFKQ
jgi:hypothetical protein